MKFVDLRLFCTGHSSYSRYKLGCGAIQSYCDCDKLLKSKANKIQQSSLCEFNIIQTLTVFFTHYERGNNICVSCSCFLGQSIFSYNFMDCFAFWAYIFCIIKSILSFILCFSSTNFLVCTLFYLDNFVILVLFLCC